MTEECIYIYVPPGVGKKRKRRGVEESTQEEREREKRVGISCGESPSVLS